MQSNTQQWLIKFHDLFSFFFLNSFTVPALFRFPYGLFFIILTYIFKTFLYVVDYLTSVLLFSSFSLFSTITFKKKTKKQNKQYNLFHKKNFFCCKVSQPYKKELVMIMSEIYFSCPQN